MLALGHEGEKRLAWHICLCWRLRWHGVGVMVDLVRDLFSREWGRRGGGGGELANLCGGTPGSTFK